ncbi:MAG: sugar phosphate isomerase/epimerase family protein [Pleurocapsa sp. MO_192.B19]|nr:sugar phosphate isomerase/epimerase family protein [Pleurocapsa sp. MO_192.B19]
MSKPTSLPDIYLSFFQFSTDMKPDDLAYREIVVKHIKQLTSFGYSGFEFHIAPTSPQNYHQDLQNYSDLRHYLDSQGLEEVKLTTNVGATASCDPSSPDEQKQQQGLEYLKSRVDITAALRGEILMGPIIVPYNVFPTTDSNEPIWSDRLQDELAVRYQTAQPILNELGIYAEKKNVKLAIEPITHWETPGPNKLSQLIDFLAGIESKQVGVIIDCAHEILDGDGPEIFKAQVAELARQSRLHYVQVSPPHRGAVHKSWIPWKSFLEPILEVYQGPIAIEMFNAIPGLVDLVRLSRRKFWIPGEDEPNAYPNAYEIADAAIQKTQQELKQILNLAPEVNNRVEAENELPLSSMV